MNGNNDTDNSINKHIIQPIFMLKKNSDTFNEIISSDIFTSYCINKLSIDTTCNQFIKLISDKQNYNKSLLCVGYEKGHYYTENCEKCRNDIIANGYVYSCNGYVHGHPFSDNCDLYECKKNNKCRGYTKFNCEYTDECHLYNENCIRNTCSGSEMVTQKGKCNRHNQIRCVLDSCKQKRNKKCIGMRPTLSNAEKIKYLEKYITKNRDGNPNIRNLYRTKCLDCCKCRCTDHDCKGKRDCRVWYNRDDCNCICNDNCTKIEVQFGVSETFKNCEIELDNFLDDSDKKLQKDEGIRRCVSRGIAEECNITIKEEINIDGILKNGKKTQYNTSIEIKKDSILEYISLNKNNKSDDAKGNRAMIHIYGESEHIRTKIEQTFKSNNTVFKPNDSIDSIIIIPFYWIMRLYPYIVNHNPIQNSVHIINIFNNAAINEDDKIHKPKRLAIQRQKLGIQS